jgi:hypothetical protein
MNDQCFGTTSCYVPGFGANGLVLPQNYSSLAPTTYSSTGRPFYDPNEGVSGTIWVSTDNGIYEYDIDGDTWTNLGGPTDYPVSWTGYLANSDNGIMCYSADRKKAYRWTGSAWTQEWTGGGYPSQMMASDSNNDVWICHVRHIISGYNVLLHSTDGLTFNKISASYTNNNYSQAVLVDYDGSDVIIFPRNDSLESDIAKRWNGSSFSDFDNTVGGKYRGWYLTDSPYNGSTKFYIGHKNVTDGTDPNVYEYNAGVRTDIGNFGNTAAAPFPWVCNGSVYGMHMSETNPKIYKWDSGTSWSEYAQLTGDGADLFQLPTVVGNKMIFMNATRLISIDG